MDVLRSVKNNHKNKADKAPKNIKIPDKRLQSKSKLVSVKEPVKPQTSSNEQVMTQASISEPSGTKSVVTNTVTNNPVPTIPLELDSETEQGESYKCDICHKTFSYLKENYESRMKKY